MDFTLLHPKVVHVPMALAILMPLVSGGVLLAWWRGALPHRAWWLTVALQAILVGGAIVAQRTGEVDEERVERVVAESEIEEHAEAAEAFTWAGAAVLAVAIGALVLRRQHHARLVALAATAGTLVVFALGYRTGQKGGALVYEHGAADAFIGPSAPALDD